MSKRILTETLTLAVEPELKAAVQAVAVADDRATGHIVRAALRAYKPVQARLAAKGEQMNLYFVETNEPVALPQGLVDFRDKEWYVLYVEEAASPGKSGKVAASTPGETDRRSFFPGVFGCYIADAPREAKA